MTSQAVMKRYLTAVSKTEEYANNKTIQNLATAIANFKKLEKEEQAELNVLIEGAYKKLQAKGVSVKKAPTKTTTTRKTRTTEKGGLKAILAELKKKLGAEKFKEATTGTDIQKDIKIPALKKGKRIVRKKGYTTNQYGTFKNQVGTAYWESRANRFDANQPSQTRKYKLADGGKFDDIYYGVVDSNNNLVFQSQNEREAKHISDNYENSIVKKYKGKGKIHKYAKGGDINSYDNPKNATHTLHIDGQNWYLEKIDSTHFYMSNNPKYRGMAHHIGQHKGESYYDEIKQWLRDTKYADGGSIRNLENIYQKHNVIREQVRFAFAKVLGLDKAVDLLDNDKYGVSPYSLVERAVYSDLLLINEIDENLISSAISEAEDSIEMEEIGSSDTTYLIQNMLRGAGLKTEFVNNRLERVDSNGNVLHLKNELPKSTMFAKGGQTKAFPFAVELLVKKSYGNEGGIIANFKGKGDAMICARALNENSPENYEYSVKQSSKYADGGNTSKLTEAEREQAEREIREAWEGKNIDDYVMYSDKFAKGGRISKEDALEKAIEMGVDFNKDFHAQSFGNELTELAKKTGYKKSPSSSGITGRAFFNHLKKIYDAKVYANHKQTMRNAPFDENTYPKGTEFAKGGTTKRIKRMGC